MQLGAFSMSLNVADLEASAAFYEKLGFSSLGGDPSGGYLMMKSGDTVIGLFHGHIPANTLTPSNHVRAARRCRLRCLWRRR